MFISRFKASFVCHDPTHHLQDSLTILSYQFELHEPRRYFGNKWLVLLRYRQNIGCSDYFTTLFIHLTPSIFVNDMLFFIRRKQSFQSRLQSNGLFATETMPVSTQIGIMNSKSFQISSMLGHQVFNGSLPR